MLLFYWVKVVLIDLEVVKYVYGIVVYWYLDFLVLVKVILGEIYCLFFNIMFFVLEVCVGFKFWE